MNDEEKENPKPTVNLLFSSEDSRFDNDTREYESIWKQEGFRIITMLEEVTGLKFQENNIQVLVKEGPSSAGIKAGDGIIRMRGNYSPDRKRSCLIHELGHRHLYVNGIVKSKELSEHQLLDLILFDVWGKLYGREFAESQVKIEKGIIKPVAPYSECWDFALSKTYEQRKALFQKVVSALTK